MSREDVVVHTIAQGQQPQTTYRDALGKKLLLDDLAVARDAQINKVKNLETKEMEWGKGRVQRELERLKREAELNAAATPLARYADDEAINEELRSRDRWNDPAKSFAVGFFMSIQG